MEAIISSRVSTEEQKKAGNSLAYLDSFRIFCVKLVVKILIIKTIIRYYHSQIFDGRLLQLAFLKYSNHQLKIHLKFHSQLRQLFHD